MLYGKVRGYHSRERRVTVRFDAALIEADGCELGVTMLDLSSSGFRIHCNAKLEVGEQVQLRLARSGSVRAVICWTRGDEAGGTFLDPVQKLG